MSLYQSSPPSGPEDYPAWEPFMHEALLLADMAEQQGEVPVGAVVVDACGRILGRGENRTICHNDPTAHAEIMALRDACTRVGNYRLVDAVLVVTLEPCLMCVGAIIQARLAGVVYAASDPKAGCLRSHLEGSTLAWSNHHFWVLGGVLQAECSAKLSQFFQKRREEKRFSITRRGSEVRS